jgi:ABC-type Na+ transport system ATPase subunit NatA
MTPGVWGLLGPNGAGKSSLMRILATITRPTEGKVLWDGEDITGNPSHLRTVLGYLPQDFGVYPNLNALEFLQYMAAIKGLDRRTAGRRIDELLQIVNLVDARKRSLGTYSGGMKQRIGIAQALLNDPQLLIVDEPTVGLDPEERVRFRNLLSDLSGNRIVILSTHIVSDTVVGIPPEMIAQFRQSPMWPGMEAGTQTLTYDVTILGDTQRGSPLPLRKWAAVRVPTLVMDGTVFLGRGESHAFMRHGADELAGILPDAQRRTLEGQDHGPADGVLAAELEKFFIG